MSASALLYETTKVLGKRRAEPPQFLTLRPATFAHNTPSVVSTAPVIINGKLLPHTKKRYQCTYNGCNNAYSKPSRLAEHERSHTGERPYQCVTCNKSYLRETHLHAHARSHLPQSSRPFTCDKPGCEKRFWTAQHLSVHIGWHDGAKPFACAEAGCSESFAKHHQLRSHITSTHSPPGTKPYRCEHPACTKSFSTNQKLKAHAKTHDEKRYACAHSECTATPGQAPTYFSTWTALQTHIRAIHPPKCMHPSCSSRTFTTQKGLRAHMKLHDQRDMFEALERQLDNEVDHQPTKKRRGGDWGRDWICDFNDCTKDFKSKKALLVHKNVTHLGQRNFACSYAGCTKAYGHKHLLQRHLAREHGSDDDASTEFIDDSLSGSDGGEETDLEWDIGTITGHSYKQNAQTKVAERKALQCPFPDLHIFTAEPSGDADLPPLSISHAHQGKCDYAFRRAYDLRRHLRASHGLLAQKESIEYWVAQKKLTWFP